MTHLPWDHLLAQIGAFGSAGLIGLGVVQALLRRSRDAAKATPSHPRAVALSFVVGMVLLIVSLVHLAATA